MTSAAKEGDIISISTWKRSRSSESSEYYIVVKVYVDLYELQSGSPTPLAYDVANGLDGYVSAVPARYVVKIIGADGVKSCNIAEEVI